MTESDLVRQRATVTNDDPGSPFLLDGVLPTLPVPTEATSCSTSPGATCASASDSVYRAKTPFVAVTWTLEIASGCSVVLVDHATEASSASYGSIHRDDDGRVVVGRHLLPALMRPVVIEVVHVLADHGSGVSVVVRRAA
jgi:hypothetical protein